MTVYILFEVCPGANEILSVHASKESAEKAIDKLLHRESLGYTIVPYKVIGSPYQKAP